MQKNTMKESYTMSRPYNSKKKQMAVYEEKIDGLELL
jgi:hypothetical protein